MTTRQTELAYLVNASVTEVAAYPSFDSDSYIDIVDLDGYPLDTIHVEDVMGWINGHLTATV